MPFHFVNEEDFEYLYENNFIPTEVVFTEGSKEFCAQYSEDEQMYYATPVVLLASLCTEFCTATAEISRHSLLQSISLAWLLQRKSIEGRHRDVNSLVNII
jgi:hypothetical protein